MSASLGRRGAKPRSDGDDSSVTCWGVRAGRLVSTQVPLSLRGPASRFRRAFRLRSGHRPVLCHLKPVCVIGRCYPTHISMRGRPWKGRNGIMYVIGLPCQAGREALRTADDDPLLCLIRPRRIPVQACIVLIRRVVWAWLVSVVHSGLVRCQLRASISKPMVSSSVGPTGFPSAPVNARVTGEPVTMSVCTSKSLL